MYKKIVRSFEFNVFGSLVVIAALFAFVAIPAGTIFADDTVDSVGAVVNDTSSGTVVDTSSDTSAVTEVTTTDTSSDTSVSDSSVTMPDTSATVVEPPASTDITPVSTDSDTIVTPALTDSPDATAPPVPAPVPTPTPELSTDKADYHPGETATIFGNFFGALQNFVLTVFGGSHEEETYTESTINVTSDESGSFSTSYNLDIVYRPLYTIVANLLNSDGTIGTEVARSSFFDSPINVTPLELDGNAVDPAGGGVDWNTIIGASCDTLETGGGVIKATCVTDPLTGDTGFNTGGSKDINDINQWQWSASAGEQTPAKDNIRHAFGAIMSDGAGHQIFYFGLDKESAGEAQIGFWLLKNKISPGTGGIFVDNNNAPAVHTNGDLLVQANYTNGGTISNLSIYKWQSGALVLIESTTPGASTGCNTAASGFPVGSVCVGVNSASATLSWMGAAAGPSIFFEGGIDLTDIGFASNSCVSEFLGETRSSQSFSAQLKDFAFGDLSTCGSVTITKDAVPDNAQDFSFTTTGTGLSAFSLDDDSDGTLPNTKTFSSLVPGSYTVTEGSVANWDLTNLSCVDPTSNSTTNLGTRTATINVGTSENVACTYTNTLQQGHIIVDKVTNPSADPQSFTFTTTGTGYSGFSLTDAAAPNDQTLNAGSYSVAETAVAGWDQTSATCDSGTPASLTLAAGQTIHCTFTNTKKGHLVVQKTTNPAADLTVFTISASGSGTIMGGGAGTVTDALDKNYEVTPGTYSVAETVPPGWTKTSDTCQNVVVAAGATVNCLLTNTKDATLTLVKTVMNNNGGTAVANNFQGKIDGGNVPWGVPQVVSASSHTASEAMNVSGYAAGSWGTDCAANGTVSLTPGQNKTCTITNDDQAAHLIVIKHVINNGSGTLAASDFSMTIGGVIATGGNTFSGAESPGTDKTLTTVGAYTVTEGAVTGYTQTSASADCAGTIALGETKTCTITNTAIDPFLTLVKTVTNNNGGTAVATAWTLSAAGPTPISGTTGSASVTNANVNSGTYTLSETGGPSGYTASSWSCVVNGGAPVVGSSVTLGAGDSATCTINNDDIAPTVTLIKNVINDNGGTAGPNAFGLKIGGTSVTSGQTLPVQANVPIELVELSLTSYQPISISGVGCPSQISGPVNGGQLTLGQVTLTPGQNITCTITNDDQPGHLIVHKVIVSSGPVDPNDDQTLWVVTLSPGNVPQNVSVVSPFDYTVNAGTYSVSETPQAGWDMTGNDCNAVVVANGETKNCTVTNTKRGHIIVDKVTDPAQDPQSFDFTTNAGSNFSLTDAATPHDSGAVVPGTYSVSEGALAGWIPTSATCSDGSPVSAISLQAGETVTCTFTNTKKGSITVHKNVVAPDGQTEVLDNHSFTVELNGGSPSAIDEGLEAVYGGLVPGAYTITENTDPSYTLVSITSGTPTVTPGANTDVYVVNKQNYSHLIVIKHVINDNGGNASAGNFTMNVSGNNPSQTSFAGVESPGVDVSLWTGSYSADESPFAGYTKTLSADCVGSIGIGETKTCTITNDDNAPSLTLVKEVTNDNGGTAVAGDWTLTATGYDTQSPDAGTYNLSESNGPAGYTETSLTCSNANGQVTSATLGLGEEVTCTFVNDDNAPKLHLVKTITNDNGGTAAAIAWTLTADGTGANDISGTTQVNSGAGLMTDTFGLSETGGPSGYLASAWSCVGGTQNGSNITLALGEEATCTINNNDIAPQLIVIKNVINDDGDVAVASDFTMVLTGSNLSTNNFAGSEVGVTVTLNAGAYTANELLNNGYVKTLSADCAGTIGVGETKTCTITNNDTPHATRTQGFWQTHTTYTSGWFSSLSPLTIGTHVIVNTNQLFAGFYASISKTSTGAKRSALDQARMVMLQQWLAAKLNCQAFGCSGTTQTLLTNAATAWAGTNTSLILSYASQLDIYNNSNDALPISGQGSATPAASKLLASLTFWNVLP